MIDRSRVEWLCVGTSDIVKKRAAGALATASGSRLLGVCGSGAGGRERAEALAQQHGAAEVFDDLDEALAKTRANCIYIATPVHRHASEATKAMAAGKHVLIEKPLGLSVGNARLMVDAAAASKDITTGCAFYRRTYPRFAHARQTLASGKLGRIVHVNMIYSAWFAPQPGDQKLWRVQRSLSGGGPMADMGCHMIDVLVALLGMPRRAYAQIGTLVQNYEVEDSSTALLTMPDGATISAHFGWSSQAFTHEMEIIGSAGKLKWCPYDTGKVTLTVGRDVQDLDMPNHANLHTPLIEDFVQAVKQNRPAVCPLSEALKTNQVMDAIYASAAMGREAAL